jgi:hypothetical protein
MIVSIQARLVERIASIKLLDKQTKQTKNDRVDEKKEIDITKKDSAKTFSEIASGAFEIKLTYIGKPCRIMQRFGNVFPCEIRE